MFIVKCDGFANSDIIFRKVHESSLEYIHIDFMNLEYIFLKHDEFFIKTNCRIDSLCVTHSNNNSKQLKLTIIIIFCLFTYNFHYNRFIREWDNWRKTTNNGSTVRQGKKIMDKDEMKMERLKNTRTISYKFRYELD